VPLTSIKPSAPKTRRARKTTKDLRFSNKFLSTGFDHRKRYMLDAIPTGVSDIRQAEQDREAKAKAERARTKAYTWTELQEQLKMEQMAKNAKAKAEAELLTGKNFNIASSSSVNPVAAPAAAPAVAAPVAAPSTSIGAKPMKPSRRVRQSLPVDQGRAQEAVDPRIFAQVISRAANVKDIPPSILRKILSYVPYLNPLNWFKSNPNVGVEYLDPSEASVDVVPMPSMSSRRSSDVIIDDDEDGDFNKNKDGVLTIPRDKTIEGTINIPGNMPKDYTLQEQKEAQEKANREEIQKKAELTAREKFVNGLRSLGAIVQKATNFPNNSTRARFEEPDIVCMFEDDIKNINPDGFIKAIQKEKRDYPIYYELGGTGKDPYGLIYMARRLKQYPFEERVVALTEILNQMIADGFDPCSELYQLQTSLLPQIVGQNTIDEQATRAFTPSEKVRTIKHMLLQHPGRTRKILDLIISAEKGLQGYMTPWTFYFILQANLPQPSKQMEKIHHFYGFGKTK